MPDIVFTVTLFGCFVFSISFFIVALIRYKAYLDKKNEDLIFITKEIETSTRWTHTVYQLLSDFILTRYLFRKLRSRYAIIEPEQPQKIEKDTLKTFGLVAVVAIIVMIISLVLSPSLYALFIGVFLSYVISEFVINSSLRQKEKILLEQQSEFMMQMRHTYYTTQAVDISLSEVLLDAPEPIRTHMTRVSEILESSDIDEDVMAYEQVAPNTYLRQFLSNCVMIQKFDDRRIKGQSIFLLNMLRLKNDIDNELYKRRELDHRLKTLSFVAIAPMYFLPAIKSWALGNLSELAAFYRGTYNIIVISIICLVSAIIYAIINDKKDTTLRKENEHVLLDWISKLPLIRKLIQRKRNTNRSKSLRLEKMLHRMGDAISLEQFYLKRVIYSIVTFIVGLIICGVVHVNIRYEAINNEYDFKEVTTSVYYNDEVKELKDYIIVTADQLKDKEIDLTGVKVFVADQGKIVNVQYQEHISNEIIRRIDKYKNDYFHAYELLIIIAASCLGYWFPYFIVMYQKKQQEKNMEDEVILFQSIILMMMHQVRVTRNDVLEALESFARIFKKSISKTIDEMASGETQALERLREDESYPPFVKIVDNLIDSDKIGIEEACDEIEGERLGLQKKREQDNRIELDNLTAYCTFIAFIPFTLVIIFYLVVPFFIYSMNMLNQFMKEMSSYL